MPKCERRLTVVWEDIPNTDISGLDFCNAEEAAAHFKTMIGNAPQEQFAVIAMNANMDYIGQRIVNSGTSVMSVVDIKLLLQSILFSGGDMVLVAHQHPNGDSTPSEPDKALTRSLVVACSLIKVVLVDHLILGDDGFFSFFGEYPEYWSLRD